MEFMTSDTAQPETKPQAKPETFRSHLPAIVAAATGAVLATVLGSLIGTAGTIAGIVIGSLASGTCSWWAERGLRRSAALATARAEALRARSHHPHAGEDADVPTQITASTRTTGPTQTAASTQTTATTRVASGRHGRVRPRRRWTRPAAFVAVAFAGCALVVTLVEGAVGKPLSAIVQDKPGHGTTFGGGAVGKAAPARPSPGPSAVPSASTTGAATPAASTTPSSSPATSATPTATPSSTPSASTPATPTPSATSPGG
jgi:hypothetical protein